MIKDNLKKEDMIKELSQFIERLESNQEIDLNNLNKEILEFAYSNKKPFEEVVKDCTLKDLKTYIKICEVDDRNTPSSVVENYFMPDYKFGYFPTMQENLELLEQIHYEDSDLADKITENVKEQMRYRSENSRNELNSMVEYNYTEAGYYMEYGMKEVLYNEIESAKEVIQEIDGMEDYEMDRDLYLSRGDYKALYNSLSGEEFYTKDEILQDISAITFSEKMTEINDVDEIKDEIYKIQKEIIVEELKVDLANDVLSIEKNGGDRHSYSKENNKIYNKSIEKAVNKLVDNDLSLEDIKGINNEKLEMYEDYFNSFLIYQSDVPTSFVENKSFEEMKPHIDDRLLDKIKEVKGEEYFDNMDLKDIREWNKLKKDLPDLEILYYENEFNEDKKNPIEYTNYEKYERDSLKTFLTAEMEDEKKYILHKVLGDLNEEKLEEFIKNKNDYIENDLIINLEYLNEKLEQTEEKEQKKVIKNEKEIENKENTKEIELI